MDKRDEKLSRRGFFSLGVTKGKEALGQVVDNKLKQQFQRVAQRPPGALPEEQFMLTCTRCGDCQPACPHEAIHLMNEASGVYKNTPFIDVYHEPCKYCEDLPCITACEPKALVPELPVMGTAQVHLEHCLVQQGQYCDYCYNSCPPDIKAITKSDSGSPKIDEDQCVGCGKCAYICVSQSGKAITIALSNGDSRDE